jgi:sirohydrochlorin ferrochelatase
MAVGKNGNGWIGLKSTAVILGGLSALAGIHAQVVVPAILREAHKETALMIQAHGARIAKSSEAHIRRADAKMSAHSLHPHPSSVSRNEFQLLLTTQAEMRDELKEIRKLIANRR